MPPRPGGGQPLHPIYTHTHTLPPFGRQVGDPPRLTPRDVDDIVAFLGTLTDGAAP